MPGTIRAGGTRFPATHPEDTLACAGQRGNGSEVEELRTEYSKTYIFDDGSFSSYVYSEPVHRRDEQGNLQPLETDAYWACFTRGADAWDGDCLTD